MLNVLAIMRGDSLHETVYSAFPLRNAASTSDSYGYLQDRYRGEGKWEHTFGRRVIVEEPDDGGARHGDDLASYYRRPATPTYGRSSRRRTRNALFIWCSTVLTLIPSRAAIS